MCTNAISHVTVEACLNSSCTSTNGTVSMLPDGERRVMATFTDLMENRKYTATLNIHYNGGVVQQSQPVEISECCLQKVSNTMICVIKTRFFLLNKYLNNFM